MKNSIPASACALLFLTIPALADPGAHMTQERQDRINRTIQLQHKILPESAQTAEIIKLPEGTIVEPQQASEKTKPAASPKPKKSKASHS